jgi:hypothetical protein
LEDYGMTCAHEVSVEGVYEAFQTELRRFVLGKVSDPAVADDILQDAFPAGVQPALLDSRGIHARRPRLRDAWPHFTAEAPTAIFELLSTH